MSVPGGGPNIGDVLRRLGPDPLIRELEAAGMSVKADRARCPFEGCADKGRDARRNLQIYTAAKPHVFCFACETKGDLLDVLQATRKWTADQAREHVLGSPAPLRPPLQVVQPPPAAEDPDKLKPDEVKRLWAGMAQADSKGEKYLEGRGLEDTVALGLVRFATQGHPDKRVHVHAKRDYRIAMLLTDVVGNPRGVQMRLDRQAKGDEAKWMSVKGSSPARAFFGTPELIESEPIVCVTEGGADTLAVAAWTSGKRGVITVGISGTSNVPKLGKELEAAGIPIAGKLFLLFTQNDARLNKSRRAFEHLRQHLVARGARAVHVGFDKEFKDIAEWLEKHRDAEWPPEDVRRACELGAQDEGEEAEKPVSPHAVSTPDRVHTDRFAQDFTTLCTLLGDSGHRSAIVGRGGELTFSEMTHQVLIGERPVDEVDLSAIRLGIELYGQHTTTEKPLKFSEEEIGKALKLLARKRPVHPVREWLSSLKWDGVKRMDAEFPAALGHSEESFACVLLARWLLSAVARPMSPGCKVDTVLVLVGDQGLGKSTFFNVLAGDDWFTDSPVNVGDKDGKMLMRKKWIVEWAELDAMRRARDKEAIRAFLTSKVDDFREPYGRGIVSAPRGCVIVGTTNNREFLTEFERRFLPVEVAKVDMGWLRANREQLLAEAVHRYRAGEQWHFLPEELDQLAHVQRDHQARDIWHDPIHDWLQLRWEKKEVTTAEILHEVLDKDMDAWTEGDQRRVAAVLLQIGWTKAGRDSYGGRLRRSYVRPD